MDKENAADVNTLFILGFRALNSPIGFDAPEVENRF